MNQSKNRPAWTIEKQLPAEKFKQVTIKAQDIQAKLNVSQKIIKLLEEKQNGKD